MESFEERRLARLSCKSQLISPEVNDFPSAPVPRKLLMFGLPVAHVWYGWAAQVKPGDGIYSQGPVVRSINL